MAFSDFLASARINRAFVGPLTEALKPVLALNTIVDILVVVDFNIATVPGEGFGVGSVIELIRASKVGCMRFRIDIALRGAGTPAVVVPADPYAAKYVNFRFDMQDGAAKVIDRYEQIWCFGFAPNNSGGNSDAPIQAHPTASTDTELAYLAKWMKTKKGGLFATGDHDYLGASMCWRMPRIRSMRRWTNADGVPPIDTPDRIDTLRPPSPAYEPGWPGGPLALGNGPHQGDLTPQPIDWEPWQRQRISVFLEKVRPHPVLCHPTLGPIDVMPDHAHEGLCHDTGTIDLDAAYDFGEGKEAEYPDALNGGPKPEPTVIAYGATLASPPYVFSKGPQPARSRFPMISVYDGHRAGVGRVATDSTWHHWFDVNIGDIKAENGDNWAKISRYYINLASWLSPPGYTTRCLYFTTFVSHFQTPGFQEYAPRLTALELGGVLRRWIVRTYGPCWITQSLFDLLDELRFPYAEIDKIKLPGPWPCLTCPPFELFEDAILGGLVKGGQEEAERIKTAMLHGRSPDPIKADSLRDVLTAGVTPAIQELTKLLGAEHEAVGEALGLVGRYAVTPERLAKN